MFTYTRRELLGMLGSASAAALAAGRPLPNILYIMADDHAAHAISAYGSRINKTPNIDRIATGGMRFDQLLRAPTPSARPAAPPSSPASTATTTASTRSTSRSTPSATTSPSICSAPATTPRMIGKWHLGSDPTGFDYWNILPGQGVYYDPVFINAERPQEIHGLLHRHHHRFHHRLARSSAIRTSRSSSCATTRRRTVPGSPAPKYKDCSTARPSPSPTTSSTTTKAAPRSVAARHHEGRRGHEQDRPQAGVRPI